MSLTYRQPLQRQSRGDRSIKTGNFNALIDTVKALGGSAADPSGSVLVNKTGSHIDRVLRKGKGPILSESPFDFTKSADEVTVSAGMLVVSKEGAAGAAMTVAEATVTVGGGTTAAPYYIYIQHEIGTATAAIQTTAASTFPTSTATHLKIALYSVYLVSSTAAILERLQFGNAAYYLRDQMPFDYTQSTASIVVAAGKLTVNVEGTATTAITIAGATVTVGGGTPGSPYYIFAQQTIGVNTAAIQAAAVSAYPVDTTTLRKFPLYSVYIDGGRAYVLERLQWGHIRVDLRATTTQTVISDWRYDTTTQYFQEKTILLTVQAKGSESAWTNSEGGEAVEETV